MATGSENVDVGAAVVGRNEKGRRLAAAVGARASPSTSSRSSSSTSTATRRPALDGETQQLCSQTSFLGHDPESFFAPGPLNLAVDCNVTGGASGGGWTIAGNLLNSVTDYGFPEDPATDYGAYFGKEVARLYRRARSVR